MCIAHAHAHASHLTQDDRDALFSIERELGTHIDPIPSAIDESLYNG